jgi:hypothetical protein
MLHGWDERGRWLARAAEVSASIGLHGESFQRGSRLDEANGFEAGGFGAMGSAQWLRRNGFEAVVRRNQKGWTFH